MPFETPRAGYVLQLFYVMFFSYYRRSGVSRSGTNDSGAKLEKAKAGKRIDLCQSQVYSLFLRLILLEQPLVPII